MYGVKGGDELSVKLHGVRLDELERIFWLRVNIDAHNLKSSLAVTYGGTTGAAEKVEEARFAHWFSDFIVFRAFAAIAN